ncbi:hypothetical protein C8Q79DRAFT_416690 [Trametes meyenii]|nr:hypothetical protein C8Q79DRAFT_416690 [Trametes meyenii]
MSGEPQPEYSLRGRKLATSYRPLPTLGDLNPPLDPHHIPTHSDVPLPSDLISANSAQCDSPPSSPTDDKTRRAVSVSPSRKELRKRDHRSESFSTLGSVYGASVTPPGFGGLHEQDKQARKQAEDPVALGDRFVPPKVLRTRESVRNVVASALKIGPNISKLSVVLKIHTILQAFCPFQASR